MNTKPKQLNKKKSIGKKPTGRSDNSGSSTRSKNRLSKKMTNKKSTSSSTNSSKDIRNSKSTKVSTKKSFFKKNKPNTDINEESIEQVDLIAKPRRTKQKSSRQILRTTIKDENSNMSDAKSTIDKLRLAFLYRDKISGEKDRRILEEERKHNNKQQALHATCKKFLLSSLDWFENEKIENKKYIRIQVDPKFDSVLYDILNSVQFESYQWVEEERNEDLVALGASVPRIITFSIRYMEE
ncbi:hypothetical protein [Clostridium tertium]|uniref:hypothetical protein n=1 Tax=Clostridium tertium TaxID=1559 RepID=UPI0023B32FB4|nr:hypothetical protein [Clostridium tertium]